MHYRRNIDLPPPIINVYPAEYNKNSLKGDFMVDRKRPVGSLADIRRAFPDATLHIHMPDGMIVSDPIEGMQILRKLPTEDDVKNYTKRGVQDAVRLMPWKSVGVKISKYPSQDISSEYELPQEIFMPYLHGELISDKEKLEQLEDLFQQGEKFHAYTGVSISNWLVYYRAKIKTLTNLFNFLAKFTPNQYQAYVYSQRLVLELGNDIPLKGTVFNARFVDRVEAGESPIHVWRWYMNLFKQYTPKHKQKPAFQAFGRHILDRAIPHCVADIYMALCRDQEPEVEINKTLKLWKRIPKFEATLKQALCKQEFYGFWTTHCALTLFEETRKPTREYIRERLHYIKKIIAPKFAAICPKAAKELVEEARKQAKQLIELFKL